MQPRLRSMRIHDANKPGASKSFDNKVPNKATYASPTLTYADSITTLATEMHLRNSGPPNRAAYAKSFAAYAAWIAEAPRKRHLSAKRHKICEVFHRICWLDCQTSTRQGSRSVFPAKQGNICDFYVAYVPWFGKAKAFISTRNVRGRTSYAVLAKDDAYANRFFAYANILASLQNKSAVF